MKKPVLFLGLLLLFSGVALAQTATPTGPPGKGQPTKKTDAVRSVSGIVKSTSTETVVVAGRDKGKDAEWTFGVEPTTDIRKGTKSIMAADLRSGDAVQVRFVERDGKALARSIMVRGKGAASTAKKTKS